MLRWTTGIFIDWLLEDFEKPCEDEALIYDSLERLSLTFERGLKACLVADFNLEMKHMVFQALFLMIKPALSSSWQEITEDNLRRARFQLQLEQIISRTGLRWKIMFPILVQLSWGRSQTFFNDNGQKAVTQCKTPVLEDKLLPIGVILFINTTALLGATKSVEAMINSYQPSPLSISWNKAFPYPCNTSTFKYSATWLPRLA